MPTQTHIDINLGYVCVCVVIDDSKIRILTHTSLCHPAASAAAAASRILFLSHTHAHGGEKKPIAGEFPSSYSGTYTAEAEGDVYSMAV